MRLVMLPRNRKGQSRLCQRPFHDGELQHILKLFIINLRLRGASAVQVPVLVVTIEMTANENRGINIDL